MTAMGRNRALTTSLFRHLGNAGLLSLAGLAQGGDAIRLDPGSRQCRTGTPKRYSCR